MTVRSKDPTILSWPYTLGGALFGLFFPLGAITFDCLRQGFPLTWASVLTVHHTSPVHWVIDTAPFFLGMGALVVATRFKKLHIVFLIQLWSRPIPTDFHRIKIETSQKCSEAWLNLSKSFVESEMLTQVSLPLEPQLLRGILLRGVGRKQQTGHVPLFLTQARGLACEKRLQLATALITGPIP
jgi:hypothetical protein